MGIGAILGCPQTSIRAVKCRCCLFSWLPSRGVPLVDLEWEFSSRFQRGWIHFRTNTDVCHFSNFIYPFCSHYSSKEALSWKGFLLIWYPQYRRVNMRIHPFSHHEHSRFSWWYLKLSTLSQDCSRIVFSLVSSYYSQWNEWFVSSFFPSTSLEVTWAVSFFQWSP